MDSDLDDDDDDERSATGTKKQIKNQDALDMNAESSSSYESAKEDSFFTRIKEAKKVQASEIVSKVSNAKFLNKKIQL